ncbi:hypothetical protein U1839_16770 [Sphingomonas sp. RT2P30]|uniref:hypothetical protein n=1 Tax=Parasphingomonas halimpatiens TaxID=3096162 RepID=UPI002FC873F1
MASETKPPAWYYLVAVLLILWDGIGCYFCIMQFKLGADAMGDATAYDRALYATLPAWYNWCYAVAVFGSVLGGIALLVRARIARPIMLVALIAIVVQFGYLFATTDIIGHKGFMVTVPFPAFIVAVGVFAWWFAGFAARRGWIR